MAAKKTPAKKSAATGSSAGKAIAKSSVKVKSGAKKTAAKKATARKAPTTKKTATKKATARKAPATKKTVTKKAPTTKKTATKKTATKAPAVDKATAKTPPAKKPTKAPAPAAAGADAEVFSDRFLEQQRAALLEQRATYERQSRSLRDEAASLVEDFQSGDVQFDEESGEGDTLNVAREQDLMMSSQALSAIEEIDHALAKFELGTYGLCEVSGKPIPKARLEAIPWARERVEYKVGGLTSR
jgi:RNA polymerase-binding transcription factor DksA